MIENKRIQLRRDTSDNWYVSNPVLLEGEIGVDLTYNIIKIGDGSTHWNDIDEWHTINNMGAVNSDLESALYNLKSDELPSIIFERLQEYTYSQYQIDNAIEDAKDALQANIDAKVDNDTYQAKISEMEGNIEGKADQGDTYTKEEVDHLIAGAGTGVTKEYVDGEISRVEGEIPSLEGYATEAWVEGKGYLTEHQDISNLATKEELPTKTSELTNDSGFLTEHQSLDDYYTKEEIDGKQQTIDNALATKADATETANRFNSVDEYLEQLHTEVEEKADAGSIPTKTSELENDSNFLTEHQPLKTINGETIVGEGNIEISGSIAPFRLFNITPDNYTTNQDFIDAVVSIIGGHNPIGNYAIKNGEYPYICEEFYSNAETNYVKLSFVEHAQTLHSIIKITMQMTNNTWTGTWTGYNGLVDYATKTYVDDAVDTAKQSIPTNIETWTFELEDGSTITKQIYVK